jgi:hypothetical protein
MVGSSTVTERLKSFLGLYIPCMLRVAMVRVGGAGGAGGIGEGEVSGGSEDGEEDVEVGVGEILLDPIGKRDGGSGDGLGRLLEIGCNVEFVQWWII